ncbi:hypothetical protein BBF96_07835 [Anoxybacter fermentans]|uniref:CobQ/CobB/MinD/ParA nucleotide binding domain-containing protein n=1 Tax=Anoxybacter fermentans TaxID=1323375 RepID=A0A3Q9HQT9_9FIRM|nr:hypothetical protein BBF96_07835 [Anoxybacter fermentans]
MVLALITVGLNRLDYKVGLLDVDITGLSIPRMFGLKGKPKQSEFGMFYLMSQKGLRLCL